MELKKYNTWKKRIADVYLRYQEREDNFTINEVAQFFSICLDKNRLQDYEITYIDLNDLKIEIKDHREESIFFAEYTPDFEEPSSSIVIKVKKVYQDQTTIEELFEVGKTFTLLESQTTITNGEFSLTFQKNLPSLKADSSNNHFVGKIIYTLSRENYANEKINLLTKTLVYNKEPNSLKIQDIFKETATANNIKLLDKPDTQNRFSYIQADNIITGIKELRIKDPLLYVEGICIENLTNCELNNYLPSHINKMNNPELYMNDYISAISFQGYTTSKTHYILKIFKGKDSILVMYNNFKYVLTFKEKNKPDFSTNFIAFKKVHYPNLSAGTITTPEINEIIANLRLEFAKDPFIFLACEEMLNFSTCLSKRLGTIKQDIDSFSPENFINMPSAEIANLIRTDKTKYFSLLDEQYIKLTNIELPKDQKKLKLD